MVIQKSRHGLNIWILVQSMKNPHVCNLIKCSLRWNERRQTVPGLGGILGAIFTSSDQATIVYCSLAGRVDTWYCYLNFGSKDKRRRQERSQKLSA